MRKALAIILMGFLLGGPTAVLAAKVTAVPAAVAKKYSIDIKCTTQARQPRCGCIMRLEHGAVKLTIRDVTSESKSEIEANAQKWWMRRRRSYGVQLVCVDRSTS